MITPVFYALYLELVVMTKFLVCLYFTVRRSKEHKDALRVQDNINKVVAGAEACLERRRKLRREFSASIIDAKKSNTEPGSENKQKVSESQIPEDAILNCEPTTFACPSCLTERLNGPVIALGSILACAQCHQHPTLLFSLGDIPVNNEPANAKSCVHKKRHQKRSDLPESKRQKTCLINENRKLQLISRISQTIVIKEIHIVAKYPEKMTLPSLSSVLATKGDASISELTSSCSTDDEWEYYDDDDDDDSIKKDQPVCNIGIPAGLLTKWDYTIWDSDEEDEELDEFSPYNQERVDPPKIDWAMISVLKSWLELLFDQSADSFHEHNKHFHKEFGLCGRRRSTSKKLREGYFVDEFSTKRTPNLKMESYYCAGKKHGLYRVANAAGDIKEFGLFIEGIRSGGVWQKQTGNAHLFHYLDEEDENDTGKNDNVMSCYLYPDYCHVLAGDLEEDCLNEGKFGIISQIECVNGIPYPSIKIVNGSIAYSTDMSTALRISLSPLLRDPYEHFRVYVDQSGIPYAGEGLYAKQELEDGSLVALFNGVRKREGICNKSNFLSFSEFKIGLDREFFLDIPKPVAKLDNYCATLAHKACHSFQPNAEFTELYHPRFGQIMSIVAKQDIRRGEEILVNYNYSLHMAPDWYISLFFHHLRNVEQKSEEYIYQYAKKRSRDHSSTITVPPPDRNSERFVPCGKCDEHVSLACFSVLCNDCGKWYHVRCLSLDQQTSINEALEKTSEFVFKCQCS